MRAVVDVLVPVKRLSAAKSRLRGAVGAVEDRRTHTALALALAMDTVRAARAAGAVRRLAVVTADPLVAEMLREDDVEILADQPDDGLNPALRHGAAVLRSEDPGAALAALQSDLPALRPAELDAALTAALAAGRAFCPDRQGTGTTLLVAGRGQPWDPRFGPGSALAHAASGAVALDGPWPSLRCDVDTEVDLRLATELGVGPHTTARLVAAS
ncbi:2-phospho-L-lactate guanylyltransferase [Streptoalloteichus hindustanus]|uniref:Phosphoenolpyruvate guanylyltransferase n=1 Tax=Streptoalloteichus hindustanus TaxID=2017 RepID=A0A1M5GRY5_STRHI|nr:2-phospho-L-lactate guanylyltransferase [Streptoalloteichus hindustanus]SHG06398.1 2-phospho-L-lactate guanylyltransferase [Streptoalloteichus hindustanus]